MNNLQHKSITFVAVLGAVMAVTRFGHFGSAFSLPDASYAIFFLGGIYLARSARLATAAFIMLVLEAGLIDFYATSVQGISDWCMSPAYWFLIPTYGGLWMAGRWFALRNDPHYMEGRGLALLALTAWASCSLAFMFSNATFYMFSGRVKELSALEYSTRVAQYYVPYVSVALLYIASAIALFMAVELIGKQRVGSH